LSPLLLHIKLSAEVPAVDTESGAVLVVCCRLLKNPKYVLHKCWTVFRRCHRMRGLCAEVAPEDWATTPLPAGTVGKRMDCT